MASVDTEKWSWNTIPEISGMVPWLLFLYGGKFTFEDCIPIEDTLEMYDCPEYCRNLCMAEWTRVLVIYKASVGRA